MDAPPHKEGPRSRQRHEVVAHVDSEAQHEGGILEFIKMSARVRLVGRLRDGKFLIRFRPSTCYLTPWTPGLLLRNHSVVALSLS